MWLLERRDPKAGRRALGKIVLSMDRAAVGARGEGARTWRYVMSGKCLVLG